MKKLVIAVCLLCLFVSTTMFSGCSYFNKNTLDYATNAVELKADSSLIKAQYQRIYVLIETNKAKFTADEWAQLSNVHFAFSESAARLEKIFADPKTVITPAELKQMYELAYIGYTSAKEIISAHQSEFTKLQWAQIQAFDAQAVDYDKQVRLILDNPNTQDINMTLGLIITLGGVAYKYLLPVLVSMI